ncbi:MAG: hypothetical protein QOE90_3691 [Thermoplasmata archaeon]|jgi:hypothetical protein|nr:hypothetical protein [Thermoplasmata archaeon]
MRSTPSSEAAGIAHARLKVEESREALARAQAALREAPRNRALLDAEEVERMRLMLAERTEAAASAAHAQGDRRRERRGRWRRKLGLGAPAKPMSTREATSRFLDERGAHDSGEDLHPHRLDRAESDLADALSRDDLAQRAAQRDARDGI